MKHDAIPPEVLAAAEETIRSAMGPFGLTEIEARPGSDHDGDPVIYFHLHYEPSETEVDHRAIMHLLQALPGRLRALGEERFPLVRHHFPQSAYPR